MKRTGKCGLGAFAVLLPLAATLLAFPPRAGAEESRVTAGPWFGVLVLDPHLADYRWDTDARPVWGAAATASGDRLAGGARVWRSSTRQATGLPGDSRSFAVGLTGVEGIGEVRVARFAGTRISGTLNAGLIRFDWSPRELALEDAVFGEPLTVELDPIHEWTWGAGVSLRRRVAGGFEAGAALERSWFALETSHRRGEEIVTQRETFGSWTARIEIAHRLFGLQEEK